MCTYCWKVVNSYLQSDSKADISADLIINTASINIAGSEEDRVGATCPPPSTYSSSLRRKTSVGYQEERFALGRFVSSFLIDNLFLLIIFGSVVLFVFTIVPREHPISKTLPEDNRTWFLYALCQQLAHPSKGLLMQTVRIRIKVHQNVFTGNQLIDWLIEHGKAGDRCVLSPKCTCTNFQQLHHHSNLSFFFFQFILFFRAEALFLGEALVEGKFVESVTDEGFSDSNALYRLLKGEDLSLSQSGSYDRPDNTSAGQEGQEPSWVKEVTHRLYESNTTTGKYFMNFEGLYT